MKPKITQHSAFHNYNTLPWTRTKRKRRNTKLWNSLSPSNHAALTILTMCFCLIQPRMKCLRRLSHLCNQPQMEKTLAFSHMARQAPERLTQWKVLTQIACTMPSPKSSTKCQEFCQELRFSSRMKLKDTKNNIIKRCPLKYQPSKYTASMSEICFGRIMERLTPKSGDMLTSRPKGKKLNTLARHG